jgi:phospholipid/cholesterol/gamma-HCH transport system substrate-binding protein
MNTERAERRTELIVGLFCVLVLAAGVGVILLLGGKRHVWVSRVVLNASFPTVGGLRQGAPVWLSGVSVGTVRRIEVGRSGEQVVRVSLEVQASVLDRIHQDSVASIGTQGLLGDKIVEISLGSAGSPQLHPGDQIKSEAPAELSKLIDQASGILTRGQEIADALSEAAHALADPRTIAAFRGSITSLRALLAQAESGPGLAHQLFYDPHTADSVRRIADEVDHMVQNIDHGVRRLDAILDTTDEEGKQLVNNLSRAARRVGDSAAELEQSKLFANLGRASSDIVSITNHVREGKGTLGSLIVDPTVYEQLVNVLGGVQRSRILRAVVRYAISRDEGKRAGKEINTPELGTPLPTEIPKPTRAKR